MRPPALGAGGIMFSGSTSVWRCFNDVCSTRWIFATGCGIGGRHNTLCGLCVLSLRWTSSTQVILRGYYHCLLTSLLLRVEQSSCVCSGESEGGKKNTIWPRKHRCLEMKSSCEKLLKSEWRGKHSDEESDYICSVTLRHQQSAGK